MYRKSPFLMLIAAGLISLSALVASAQTGQLRGHVKFKQADGTMVPAADAIVDVFRTDLAGKFEAKTNKKGEFVWAGLPFVGRYIIAVSMPGAAPSYLQGVRAGQDIDYELILSPGDGRRLTLDEVNAAIKSGGGGSAGGGPETAETRAKRAELLKANEEIKNKNAKASESNRILGEKFKQGNAAITAGDAASKAKNFEEAEKHYTEAIASFDEGIAADPTHPGAPSLMTSKVVALKGRGVARYNSTITSAAYKAATQAGDNSAQAMVEPAKKDWKDAADEAQKALDAFKAQPAPTDPNDLQNYNHNIYFALLVRSDALSRVVTKVDPTRADAGVKAYDEYIAVETDPARKARAEHDKAKMLFDANELEKARVEYEKILATNQDDVDALASMGLILFSQGAMKDGEGKKDEAKATYQEAANYLQRFIDKAPDDNPIKADAKGVLEELKNQQNVKAEKTSTSTPTRRRRP